MGYSSNKKFSPLTDDINLVIDGCGETNEKKYYFNGTYTDLCGLSIEDYMKNPCCCGSGSNSGDNDEDVKSVNNIVVKAYEEDGVIYYQAISKFAVTSNIKITVASTNNNFVELEINMGESKSKAEIGDTLEIKGTEININEDETYVYEISSEIGSITYDIYNKAILLSSINDFSAEFTKTSMEKSSISDINFVIPAGTVDYNQMTDMEEFDKYCKEHEYCLCLYLPKSIYEKAQYTIVNYGGTEITDKFVYNHELNIENVDCVCIVEKATDDIMPYVQLYNEELVYEYKLKLNN